MNKYKHNRDDVKCNIEVETEIDVQSDIKQTAGWQWSDRFLDTWQNHHDNTNK